MNRNWRWALPCYVFLLPLAIVAFAYAVVIARARSWEWRDGVLTFVVGDGGKLWGNPGGQGWSWIVGYADEYQRSRADLRVHENVHVVQEFVCSLIGFVLTPFAFAALEWSVPVGLLLGGPIGGPLFALAYGACFVWFYAWLDEDDWRVAYRRNPFERHAYAVQTRFLDNPTRKDWGA